MFPAATHTFIVKVSGERLDQFWYGANPQPVRRALYEASGIRKNNCLVLIDNRQA
jgi:hypothetical protein